MAIQGQASCATALSCVALTRYWYRRKPYLRNMNNEDLLLSSTFYFELQVISRGLTTQVGRSVYISGWVRENKMSIIRQVHGSRLHIRTAIYNESVL